ncbi:MAG: hypothetical protein A2383_01435 [Candidatus Pacebacteria bacterium RIFOXYB1_FULL_39_46]|nr:MAG: hypothetical protein A2383_01435 [Candidatus Pacebacteria bacterium RIFOXYB1_FULL_39_46]OGJ39053.1 MAG: hypothetical protein A2182_01855 [Candidatus Pacebacteria bacterium RIFOXYA1_FULL_38_18]OGJ40024.1 MAG: hypothetical protein A2582_01380 [Candidatus Pacebacteria bacterium RIFOXYD1_FULL_39_27]OGJ40714.1 MAG: hypothetical protein A2411_00315 [Candidatus Pacebacteria bacterium RIFOXYC1_FULL_39_21]
MSDKPTRIRTENLDDSASSIKQASSTPQSVSTNQPVDDQQSTRHNQPVNKTVKMSSLDLEKETKQKTTKKTGTPMTTKQRRTFLILGAVAIVAGLATGYGAFRLQLKSNGESPAANQQVAGEIINNGDVFGIKDDQTFKDSAEGYLEKGGIDGEGSHSLLREGGESQTVYLTSSITDLDKLVGMKVKVWGETFKSQTAGWLMDVGRVQVIEKEATPPVED